METQQGMMRDLAEQVLDQLPTPVMAVDTDLKVIYINAAGCAFLGKSESEVKGKPCADAMGSHHCDTSDCCMRKAIAEGTPYGARNIVPVGGEDVPIHYLAAPLRDADGNIVGGLEYALDITEQVRYEERLREQSRTIREISTPAIQLWDGVVTMPVVGVVDSARAKQMMDSMLAKIAETSCKVIILDIQGVAAVDTAVANHLIKITKATRLMGCQCIISGVSPAVAEAIVQLGIDMGDVKTNSTLRDALQDAFDLRGLRVIQA